MLDLMAEPTAERTAAPSARRIALRMAWRWVEVAAGLVSRWPPSDVHMPDEAVTPAADAEMATAREGASKSICVTCGSTARVSMYVPAPHASVYVCGSIARVSICASTARVSICTCCMYVAAQHASISHVPSRHASACVSKPHARQHATRHHAITPRTSACHARQHAKRVSKPHARQHATRVAAAHGPRLMGGRT
jgi:hypothetical protein